MALMIEQLPADCFSGSKVGLEKEGLRITSDGRLAADNHPTPLGSSLTHPSITTDFAESLVELISPPFKNSFDALRFIGETETFLHRQLTEQLIWSASMPCEIKSEDEIRIADYGHSQPGMRKMIYRRGLAHRYGKQMQMIAGIHFNFSFSDRLWSHLHRTTDESGNLKDFIADRSMAAIRNALRHDWLLLYLFGASPATSNSFRDHSGRLIPFDGQTSYLPHATSLRMGDGGYANTTQIEHIGHNSLNEYIDDLHRAINTPYPAFEQFEAEGGNGTEQLSNSLLQTENEYYSTVRPKQITQPGETLLEALRQRGIGYLELRAIDINPFVASGIEADQLCFLELFMHHALLTESAETDHHEMEAIRRNRNATAYYGRDPQLRLTRYDKEILLTDWAGQIFEEMLPIAERLDRSRQSSRYSQALVRFKKRLTNPDLTPSGQLLKAMQNSGKGFTDYILTQSVRHHRYYLSRTLPAERVEFFQAMARHSYRQTRRLERCVKCKLANTEPNRINHQDEQIEAARCACH